jgi:PAS domain S-box-containing protein
MTDPVANRRILVIDDNEAIHADFRKILAPERRGQELDALEADLFGATPAPKPVLAFTVDSATQGRQGLECIVKAQHEERPYALAFVDMRMPPGWDGMETTVHILAQDPNIQVVICTAYTDYSWEEMANQLGATDRVLILKKPFDNVEVIQLAQALSQKWNLARQAQSRMAILEHLVQMRVKELAASNTQLSELIRLSPVGIFARDQDGKVVTWNPASERILGWSADELVGRGLPGSMPGLVRSRPPDLPSDLATNAGNDGIDLTLPRKDGSTIDVTLYTAGLRDAEGGIAGCISILADITSRKQVEEELRRAKAIAESAAEAKSNFLATMSHEIRTPMNGVMGMAQLLLESRLDAEQKDFVETILSSGESLLTIINDILDFSKIDAGMLTLSPIPFDLPVAISSVVELLAPKAHAKGLELICRFAPELPMKLIGDAGRVRQVVTNLVGNAIKFTQRGHILVDVACARVADGVAAISVAVQDTGIGIPADRLERLFVKFSQADSSTTREYGGTGLGLAICKQLAELMGGTVTVTSHPGTGSTFTVRLPLAIDPSAQSGAAPADVAGLQVLVVETHSLTRRVFEEQLRAWGCVPRSASSAGEALATLQAARRDDPEALPVAIVDSGLVEPSASELAAAIRSDPLLAGTALLLLAAVGMRGDAKKAKDAGFDAYLGKPLRMEILRGALATLRADQMSGIPHGLVTRHSLSEAVPMAPASAVSGPRVLLVEDNMVNQQVALRLLERLGCRVVLACDGEEALRHAAGGGFDLIFMDYHLPGSDGVEITRQLRRREAGGRRVPIVAMSASVLDGDRQLFRDAGMDGFTAKPVQMAELRACLARWCPAAAPA